MLHPYELVHFDERTCQKTESLNPDLAARQIAAQQLQRLGRIEIEDVLHFVEAEESDLAQREDPRLAHADAVGGRHSHQEICGIESTLRRDAQILAERL